MPGLLQLALLFLATVAATEAVVDELAEDVLPVHRARLRLSVVSEQFKLAKEERVESLVLHDGRPSAKWAQCAALHAEVSPRADCYTHPSSASHTFFYFSLRNESTSDRLAVVPFALHPKLVEVTAFGDARGADAVRGRARNLPAESADYFFRDNHQRGAFTVPSQCTAHTSGSMLAIAITFFGYVVRFTQACGSGNVHDYISATVSGLPVTHGYLSQVVASDTTISHVKMQIKSPLSALSIASALVFSNDSTAIAVQLGETSPFDFVSLLAPYSVDIEYECEALGPVEADITLVLSVPPYDNVELSWRKACGGWVPPVGLSVSTFPWLGDIARNGAVQPKYSLAGEVTEVLPSQSHFDIYVGFFSFSSYDHLEHGSVEWESSDRTIVDVSLLNTARSPGLFAVKEGYQKSFQLAGGVVERGRQKHFRVAFACLSHGQSEILLSVKFRGGTAVRFGFIKKCAARDAVLRLAMHALLPGGPYKWLLTVVCVSAVVYLFLFSKAQTLSKASVYITLIVRRFLRRVHIDRGRRTPRARGVP